MYPQCRQRNEEMGYFNVLFSIRKFAYIETRLWWMHIMSELCAILYGVSYVKWHKYGIYHSDFFHSRLELARSFYACICVRVCMCEWIVYYVCMQQNGWRDLKHDILLCFNWFSAIFRMTTAFAPLHSKQTASGKTYYIFTNECIFRSTEDLLRQICTCMYA